jgi:hypothetical protein
MRIKVFFLTGIMGIAVVSGIIKGLSSQRGRPKKEEEAPEKEECLERGRCHNIQLETKK